MIDKRVITAAKAFRKSLLNGGQVLVKNRQLNVEEAKSLGIKRRQYKSVSLEKLLLCSVLSKKTGELFVSDGHIAFGPMPIPEKVRRHLFQKTILPWGDPVSLSVACPPLIRLMEDEDAEETFALWKTSLERSVSDGKSRYQNYVVLSNGTRVNVVYFAAAVIHGFGETADYQDERINIYQDPKNSLSPVIFTSAAGEGYAIVMPIRGD